MLKKINKVFAGSVIELAYYQKNELQIPVCYSDLVKYQKTVQFVRVIFNGILENKILGYNGKKVLNFNLKNSIKVKVLTEPELVLKQHVGKSIVDSYRELLNLLMESNINIVKVVFPDAEDNFQITIMLSGEVHSHRIICKKGIIKIAHKTTDLPVQVDLNNNGDIQEILSVISKEKTDQTLGLPSINLINPNAT